MLGNVGEWCHDGGRIYTADAIVNPMGLAVARADRLIRGGGWSYSAQGVRAVTAAGTPPASAAVSLASAVRVQAGGKSKSRTSRVEQTERSGVGQAWECLGVKTFITK